MRSPIWWFGGKGHMTAKLLPLIPPHRIYVEAFGGGASLLFAKRPSPIEVYNDLDEALVGFFRVLRDPDQFARFRRLAELTPYARSEYNLCRASWQDCDDPVERAWRWFVVARMSFSGSFAHSWSSAVTHSRRHMAATCSKWLSAVAGLPQAATRLLRVQIECQDWRVILDRYDTPETFFYLDPPYIAETRRDGGYKHELTLADHRDLVGKLLTMQGQAMLSGYAHEVYLPLEEAGWRRLDWKAACHAAGRTRATGILGDGAALRMQPRIESVWCSPLRMESLPLFDKKGEP